MSLNIDVVSKMRYIYIYTKSHNKTIIFYGYIKLYIVNLKNI